MATKTYGTLTLKDNEWIINCEPHARTKFKRVFPQVRQHAALTLSISNNLANCHDLQWFMARYPLRMDKATKQHLKLQSASYEQQQADILNIIDGNKAPMEFELAVAARPFQKVAADLLIQVKGLLLGDDVGLGKTASSICAMCLTENLPVLVVTLTNLTLQIQREVNRFAPQLKTHVLKKSIPYSLTQKDESTPDVIITSYSKLHGWAEHLAGKINYVVFDEVQELRTGSGSLKYEAAKLIAQQSKLRLGLSATPIYNYGHEFFNVIDILREGVLGTRQEFLREWCVNDQKIADPKAFGAYLRDTGIMLRRTREEVQRELPLMRNIPQHINSDTKIFDNVKGYATELARIILQDTQDFKGQKLRATEQFNILMRQATGVAKAPYVAEFVKLLVESGESVVLFGWHREVYNIWLERLAEYNPVLYTGSESAVAKERSKNAFMNDESKVMIVSLRSGAGLDGLQYHPNCSIAVFGELDWSAGVHEQCSGRLHRDGQTKSILSYYLLSESGSDPIISDTLGIKQQQLEGVRNKDGDLIAKLEGDTGSIKKLASEYLNRNKRQEFELESDY